MSKRQREKGKKARNHPSKKKKKQKYVVLKDDVEDKTSDEVHIFLKPSLFAFCIGTTVSVSLNTERYWVNYLFVS